MIPFKIADEEVVRPRDGSEIDEWSLIVNLDPAKDWSRSTFTVDGTAGVQVDQSEKGATPPRLVVFLTPDAISAAKQTFQFWNLAEDTVLDRTFLAQRLKVVDRFLSGGATAGESTTVVNVTVGAGAEVNVSVSALTLLPPDAAGWLHNTGNGSLGWSAPTPAEIGADTPAARDIAIAVETSRAQVAEALKADLVAGKVPTSQLPAISIDHGAITVANAATRYALVIGTTVEPGQPVVQASTGQTFILVDGATDASQSSQWVEIPAIGKVQTVNGQSGAVVLGKVDIGLGNVDNTSDANKPVSTAQAAADASVLSTAEGYTDTKITAEVTRANGAYQPVLDGAITAINYNGDGTIANVHYATGVVITYTYNGDGSVHTSSDGTTTRTFTYNGDGTLASVA